jgi:ABC-2 type transport system permease protein
MGIIQPISLDVHLIGNPWANYGVYLLNVLLPGELQLMVLLLTIFSIGIELKERTARSWLKTANHSFSAALLGKALPYTFVFTIIGVVGDILLYRFMHYPMQASIGWMFLATFLFVIAYQAIGIFLIGLLPVLRDGVMVAAFYGLLAFTYAGFTFPIEYMPSNIRIFSELFPIRHYFRMYVNEALLGLDIRHSLVHIAAMSAFLLLPLLVFTRLKKAVIYLHYPIK